MSSTSSSTDYEYADFWQYTNQVRRSSTRTAIYSGLRNPLIYRAELPQSKHKKSRAVEKRKRNRNFFVKAFKWYTQDRSSVTKDSETENEFNNEMKGFALWLDNKYFEYIAENEDHGVRRLKLRQASALVTDTLSANPCGALSTKQISIDKSKLKKAQRPETGEDRGDGQICGNRSVEYIMQPKELSRPPSQCYAAVRGTSCNTSKATVSSSQTCLAKVKKEKKAIDTASYTLSSKNVTSAENTCECTKKDTSPKPTKSCQYGSEIKKTNIETQCGDIRTDTNKQNETLNIPCISSSKTLAPTKSEVKRTAADDQQNLWCTKNCETEYEIQSKSYTELCNHCSIINKQNQATSPVQILSPERKKNKSPKKTSSSKTTSKYTQVEKCPCKNFITDQQASDQPKFLKTCSCGANTLQEDNKIKKITINQITEAAKPQQTVDVKNSCPCKASDLDLDTIVDNFMNKMLPKEESNRNVETPKQRICTCHDSENQWSSGDSQTSREVPCSLQKDKLRTSFDPGYCKRCKEMLLKNEQKKKKRCPNLSTVLPGDVTPKSQGSKPPDDCQCCNIRRRQNMKDSAVPCPGSRSSDVEDKDTQTTNGKELPITLCNECPLFMKIVNADKLKE